VVRGIARPNAIGRTPKEIETATEFTTPDLQITRGNGVRAQVVLPLTIPLPPLQQSLALADANAVLQVRDALGHLAAMAEWAGSGSAMDIEEMVKMIPDSGRRQRVAWQAMRLLPSKDGPCTEVEFGGRAISRIRPIVLRPPMSGTLQKVVRHGQQPRPFELIGEVRMVDVDMATVGVLPDGKKKRLHFWTTDDVRLPTEVPTRVKISGETYMDPLQHEFYLATSLVVLDEVAEDDN
jgi:hypothetical protein